MKRKFDIKSIVMLAISLLVLSSLAVTGRAKISEKADVPDLATISPEGHQAIAASVINDDPARYTIDVRKFSNIGVDENAPTFAVYLTNSLPSKCGDFRDLELNYSKPDKYKRVFNLSEQEKVVRAIDEYGCVVMRNIPSGG